ncbi:MAG: PfkB family carbohydrate kinase [Promethearchaeota archaeon]
MAIRKREEISFLFIGHIAIDTIIRFKQKRKPSLGGTVTFGSFALKTYSNSTKIGVISNVGLQNFNKSLLNQFNNKNIDFSGVKMIDTNNTNFELNYSNHTRRLTLKSCSPKLTFEDIPEKILSNPPTILILAPLCNEISFEYVSKVVNAFPNVYIGIDLQGFIRHIDNDGEVSYVRDAAIVSNMIDIINLIGDRLILKGSEVEMKLVSNHKEPQKIMDYFTKFENKAIYIMTMGEAGSILLKNGEKRLKIPAYKPKRVLDETGAGDVYLTIFLYELLNSNMTWDAVEKSAHIASAAASFLVEKKGPKGFETKKRILKRVADKNYIN